MKLYGPARGRWPRVTARVGLLEDGGHEVDGEAAGVAARGWWPRHVVGVLKEAKKLMLQLLVQQRTGDAS